MLYLIFTIRGTFFSDGRAIRREIHPKTCVPDTQALVSDIVCILRSSVTVCGRFFGGEGFGVGR